MSYSQHKGRLQAFCSDIATTGLSGLQTQFQPRFWLSMCFVGLVLFCVTGCQPDEQITVHELPAWKTGLPEPRPLPPMAGMPRGNSIAGPRRMVVAMASRADATWFFKLDNHKSAVDGTEEQWRRFLTSISFDSSGKPQWVLPETWQAKPGNGDRLATLTIPVAGSTDAQASVPTQLDLAVSSLSPNQDLLGNVNRWRGQLGLPPVTDNELATQITTLEYQGGQFTLFDAQASVPDKVEPVASANSAPQVSSTPVPSAPDMPLRFTKPESWVQLPQAMFALAKFSRKSTQPGSEAEEATISITPMSMNNTWEESLSSWAAEAEIPEQQRSGHLELTQSITIGGAAGKFILLPDATQESSRAIAAARVEHGDRAWYFKMSGPQKLVLESQPEFEAFLKSVQFQ